MVITSDTKWITLYEQLDGNEYDVRMTISEYKDGKLIRSFKYYIPLEFYDDVRIWDWQVVIGADGINGTPVISYKQDRAIRQLTKTKKFKLLSLNNITPFAWICKNGKTMVSSKNDYSYIENCEKGVVWYKEDERKKAVQCYDKFVEKCFE